ncbi:hypothetical protein GCM10011403_17450 [Pseudohongiella nitratireducens]|uniref:Uncharacterized protein n=1 Tax=Pseudohongiella nitratireducens TaxID=1768907 RepID=A0A916QJ52_9GAMM|nr:hypothetical protein GCM10011403_17450 [Pseudohongiella nitratireducens]
MNQVGGLRRLMNRIKNILASLHIVALKVLVVQATNLCLEHDNHIRVTDKLLPLSRFGQVREMAVDIGLDFFESGQVALMFVDHMNVRVTTSAESGAEILADQPGAARQDDFHV